MEDLANKCDILCIQEHWLLAHEGKEMEELFPNHRFIIKCVDDNMPILPMLRTRGTGGTAILWRENIDGRIDPLPEGRDRLCAVKIKTPNENLLLINTYMPTMGAAHGDYNETLDEVAEMLHKYSECTSIWTGDINAAQRRSTPTTNDIKLQKFCTENGLRISAHMPQTPTFYHFNGKSMSQIDLFIQRKDDEIINSIKIHQREALNVSPHDPVTASIHVTLEKDTPRKEMVSSKPPRKVRWDKIDIVIYKETTEAKLTALKENMKDLPACLIADRLNQILSKCALDACPPPPKRKRDTRFRWSSEFKPLADGVIAAYKEHIAQSPIDDNKLATLRTAKKLLRKAQRRAAARRRHDLHTAIIASCKKPNKHEFHKLIKKQRRENKKTTNIEFGEHTDTSEAESWANYYEKLATPQEDPTFDKDYSRYLQVNYLLQSLTMEKVPLPEVSQSLIHKYVSSLKNQKAPDIYGIASEHLKLASPILINILTHLANNALTTGKLPEAYKVGSVCPVPKKAKSRKLPTNHRRITITSLVGKIVEIHMMAFSRPILDACQSRLQFGFTKGCSPVFAALVVTEVMADATDNNDPLFITLMDTSKAFDVVRHTSMLNALYQQGITNNLWKLYENMYSGITSVVKWKGEHSRPFAESQGIRQGGNSSADKYKSGKNKLLVCLDNHTANKIGHVHAGAAMVADDLALSSTNKYDLQVSVAIAEHDAAREGYKFNVDKTKVITLHTKCNPELQLNGQTIGISECEPHLGIMRNSKGNNTDTVESRIRSARKTVFSLLGAGFYGLHGTGPLIAVLKYRTYVVPTLLYGLEALTLGRDERSALGAYHRQCLRCIQHFPKSTAIPAIHLLSGTLPVDAMLHINALTLFRSAIAAEQGNPPSLYIRELLIRQLAVKDDTSASWTVHIKALLRRYQLPPASSLIDDPPSKTEWKKVVKLAVHEEWTNLLQKEASNMTSLQYLNIDACSTNHIHPIWQDLESPLSIKQATVKALLLIKRYPLTTSPTAGTRRRDTCPLCNSEPETVTHFLLQCDRLSTIRTKYLRHILPTLREYKISIDLETLTSAILDSTFLPNYDSKYEKTCRNMIYKLHSERAVLLGGVTGYKCT